MKYLFTSFLLLLSYTGHSQDDSGAVAFWESLQTHCGKAYEGTLAEHVKNDSFSGKKLTMYVRSCDDGIITIPFYVGEDRSRTWVLTLENGRIKLKHDHRHEDGSEDSITQYGGTAPNPGLPHLQIFPADEETAALIPYASTNVWWITVDGHTFSYNLKRVGTENPEFTVIFDLSNPVEAPPAPWGWED